jgi:hypothetical protein
MRVRINAARHHIAAAGINRGRAGELLANAHNPAAVDKHIGTGRMIMINNSAAANECGHGGSP